MMQKVAVALVLVLLGFAVYDQRSTLQDCADQVAANMSRSVTDLGLADTQCSFLGTDVTISDPRGNDT